MKYVIQIFLVTLVLGCASRSEKQDVIPPVEIIDLGALVTEDLPERVWGGLMELYGFEESNSFKVIQQESEFADGKLISYNSYLTIFNHGGPHVDVPRHVNFAEGINSYSADDFIGPLKVIDASHLAFGRTVSLSEIKKYDIQPGDIVLIYTNYTLPAKNEIPRRIALTQEAAEYLAQLPVKAFGTDSFNVDSDDNPTEVNSASALQRIAPVHFEFLSRGIPVYEQLFNVGQLLQKEKMLFIGQPLNIENGDGMIVRPVVFVYK